MALLRPQTFEPKLAEIGRLYKGSKKTDRKPGSDLSYFRFEPSERTYDMPRSDGQVGSLAQQLIEAWQELGDNPRNVSIRFLYSDIEKIFPSSNEVWKTVGGRSRCVTRCNGQTQTLHLEEEKGKKILSRSPIACLAKEGQNECPNQCKPTGRLIFTLPDLKYPGQIVLTTHSINDIINIQGNLRLYENMDLSKIPFRLCRTKQNVQYQQGVETKVMEKWICHIEIDPAFGQQFLAAQPKQYLAELQGAEVEDVELVIDESPDIAALPVAVTKDWKTIMKHLSFDAAKLKSVAIKNGLPDKSSELNSVQSNTLFFRCLQEWAIDLAKKENLEIFGGEKGIKESLENLGMAPLADAEMIETWMAKCFEEVSKANQVAEVV